MAVAAIVVLSAHIIMDPLDAALPHKLVVQTNEPKSGLMTFSYKTRDEAEAQAAKFVRGTISRDPHKPGD
jgi:hypothetical protein